MANMGYEYKIFVLEEKAVAVIQENDLFFMEADSTLQCSRTVCQ
jgi:hypothetical protein